MKKARSALSVILFFCCSCESSETIDDRDILDDNTIETERSIEVSENANLPIAQDQSNFDQVISQYSEISEGEIQNYISRARQGDQDAALDLGFHYLLIEDEDNLSDYWFEIAAQVGNIQAARALVVTNFLGDENDCVQAQQWLRWLNNELTNEAERDNVNLELLKLELRQYCSLDIE